MDKRKLVIPGGVLIGCWSASRTAGIRLAGILEERRECSLFGLYLEQERQSGETEAALDFRGPASPPLYPRQCGYINL